MTRHESSGAPVFVHTIDGTAGSGKGTVANSLREQGISVLDTGKGYRAATEFWYRLQEDSGLDCSDQEAVERRLYSFRAPFSRPDTIHRFTSRLSNEVRFGVDGVSIGGETIPEEQESEILYAERISHIISFIAQLQPVRKFCKGISAQFVNDAIANGEAEVGLDGRAERQEIIQQFQIGEISTGSARLALPAFFEAESREAARRILARDTDRKYEELSPNDEVVKTRAAIVQARNEGDSDPNGAEPMGYTIDHFFAWHDYPAAVTDRVIGNREDGSDARSVRFDTTDYSPEEVLSKYEEWRTAINDRVRRSAGIFAVSYPNPLSTEESFYQR